MNPYAPAALKCGVAVCWFAAIVKFWPSDRWPLAAPVAYIPPILTLFAVLLLGLMLKRTRLWRILAVSCSLLCGFTFVKENSRLLHGSKGQTDAVKSVRIFQWNVWGSRRGSAKIAAAIAEQRPDIVCLNEPKSTRKDPEFPDYASHLGGQWHEWGEWNMLLLSRFKIHPIDSWKQEGVQGLYASIESDPPFTLLLIDIAANTEVFRRDVFESFAARFAATNDFPDVIAGDWNTPVKSFSIQSTFGADYNDSYETAGKFVGYTWPAWLPLMRIDFTLTRKTKGVTRRYHTGSTTLSDHRWQWIEYGAAPMQN